ncbi:Alpha-taxilin [Holothuria leucospilota]|uniref:Alpha-taxilin n=1 Tax=Holothuria leucospilota TaxID=206669 RepID=A0A9Q1BJ05_HOLLE|nr:Alpha-taxilin [Holothuria leucospilota]
MGGGFSRLWQIVFQTPLTRKRPFRPKMETNNAVEEEKLLKQSDETLVFPEEKALSPHLTDDIISITDTQQDFISEKKDANSKEENIAECGKEEDSSGIVLPAKEAKEMDENSPTDKNEDPSEHTVHPLLQDVSSSLAVSEVKVIDTDVQDKVVVETLLQSAESPLTTPEEETAPPLVAAQVDEVASFSEENSDKEKIVDKAEIKKEEQGSGKNQKESKKPKKGRDSEHMSRAVMQALAGLDTPEEKIAALCKKYAELLGEHKSLQREHKAHQKQLSVLQRDRDQLQSEHGRAILAKSKLESLCRELQRHNKTIKEESLQRAREEEEKRKEVSAKFQQTINEITTQMQDNHTRNLRLKEENLELASKLKKLVEQYERREEHIEKIFKHKELESQLYDAKLQQSNLALQEEQERCKRERSILMNETAEAQTKCEMLMKQETQLKAQLAVYTEKFEEFQTTLTKSNEIFQTFKQEMDQMTKKIKKLEKETNMWRVRWENSNKSLLNMAEERTLREKELAGQKNKISKLENLCRALQAERNALLGKARSLEGNLSSPSKNKTQTTETIVAVSKEDAAPANVLSESNTKEPSPEQASSETSGGDLSEPKSVDTESLVNGEHVESEEVTATGETDVSNERGTTSSENTEKNEETEKAHDGEDEVRTTSKEEVDVEQTKIHLGEGETDKEVAAETQEPQKEGNSNVEDITQD